MYKNYIFQLSFIALIFTNFIKANADDGYRLWLKYDKINNPVQLNNYQTQIQSAEVFGNSSVIENIKHEIDIALTGLLDKKIPVNDKTIHSANILIGTPSSSKKIASLHLNDALRELGDEGYLIRSDVKNEKYRIYVIANTDIGLLYGTFNFIKILQLQQNIDQIDIKECPKIQRRVLNHWDNLNRSVERGYAGMSLWNWNTLPEYIDQRYIDYARANASIGINGTVLNNVNANSLILTPEYLLKVAALANLFRNYGIKVYLTARFSAPIEIGGLKTADPLNDSVIIWWKKKVNEIYTFIPDFGGFLVKANSEGQPGPQDYQRNHADGANMLADALAPYQGIVMWRAFVYSNEQPVDRAMQAYNEFLPLDGKFRKNVMVQIKNGPIDFQPREPFHPLFGALTQTSSMMEFQITQEYMGQGIHLTYLAPLYKECLQTDTWAIGEGSTVAKIIDGRLYQQSLTGMAGVANIGTDRNWTGNPFAQANWYALGRLAWNHELTAEQIAEDWVNLTLTNNTKAKKTVVYMMMQSREAQVNFSTPLGLHHQMAWHHHYGPGPWISNKPRADWTSVYYNKAAIDGIGFDRTVTGSNALSQYSPEIEKYFTELSSCPDEYLLWFHHLPWDYRMRSGKSLWDELCFHYSSGVDTVIMMKKNWQLVKENIDTEIFNHVNSLLSIQVRDAREWRNACILYFQTFSKLPIPLQLEAPEKTLEDYQQVDRKFLPGS